MNALLWIAQIILAAMFLFVGSAKVFAYPRLKQHLETHPKRMMEMSRGAAACVGIVEIFGAVALLAPAFLLPADLAADYLLVRLAAGGLGLMMVAAGIYHAARREPAAPAVTLFLLALFVIVGRWPH